MIRNWKNLLLIIINLAILSLFLSFVNAESVKLNPIVVYDFKLILQGYANFQAAYRNQNNLVDSEKNVSAKKKCLSFFNLAGMFTDLSNQVNNITYGGKIILVPTAKKKSSGNYNGSNIYLESEFGRIELGSPIDAASKMLISGYTIVAATGNNWSMYINFDLNSLKQGKDLNPSFAPFAEYFLDSKLITNLLSRSYSNEPGRKISYYTPKFNIGKTTKLQVGISYILDSSNTGADNPNINSSGIDKKILSKDKRKRFEIDKNVKDAVSGGITIEQNISDGIDFRVALTGEYGKAAGKAKQFNVPISPLANDTTTVPVEYELNDLRSYNIGGVLNVGNFSYAGSYGSLGKSLTTPAFHKTGRNTIYYTGAVAYKQGPFITSITYFKSDQFKNTVDAITLGTDYKIAPGLKPYAEIAGFVLKGKPEYYPELNKKKTRGTVVLIGTKLSL